MQGKQMYKHLDVSYQKDILYWKSILSLCIMGNGCMKDKPVLFYKIWDLHLKFMSTDWWSGFQAEGYISWIQQIQTSIQCKDDKKLPSLL